MHEGTDGGKKMWETENHDLVKGDDEFLHY